MRLTHSAKLVFSSLTLTALIPVAFLFADTDPATDTAKTAQTTTSAEDYLSTRQVAENTSSSADEDSGATHQSPGYGAVPTTNTSKTSALPGGYVKMSGSYRLSAGAGGPGGDVIYNDSNAGKNMNNLQGPKSDYLFGERLHNTYDRAIYDQHKLNIEFSPAEPISFYTEIVNDPWSLVGTTGEQIQVDPDEPTNILRYNLKYFGSNNATLGEIYRTRLADRYNFPSIEVKDGQTVATVIRGATISPATGVTIPMTIPALDIDYEYRPIRKLWMDFNHEALKLRIFALADESQALTTDDPLGLSNHKDYWEASPWLYSYYPAQFFFDLDGNSSVKRGYYSNDLAFQARDSEGNRLVLLRGFSGELVTDKVSFSSTVASPHTPWDEYDKFNNIPGASRLKYQLTDDIMVGATHTFRLGQIDDNVDDYSQVVGVDTKIKWNDILETSFETAYSYHKADILTITPLTNYTTSRRGKSLDNRNDGYAYKATASSKFDHEALWNGHTQLDFSYTQMDRYFKPALSRYLSTRDDKFWGNHISFDEYPDVEPFKIGDGVDINRFVFRIHWKEQLLEERLTNAFDVRNVHKTLNTAYVETVFRDELTYKFSPSLTGKGLFRWRDLPETTPNIEPSLTAFYFPTSEVDLSDFSIRNDAVRADQNADQFTYSGALQYVVNPQWKLEGVYERTNNIPDFPRGLLSDFFKDANDRVDNLLFDRMTAFVYGQNSLKAAPPYDYFNIFRERAIFTPQSNLKLIGHAAQNGYKFSGGIDDNINHVGLSTSFDYSKKLSFFSDYTFSKQIDISKLVASSFQQESYDGHHNVYFSADYKFNPATTLRTEYGVFDIGHSSGKYNPYSVSTFSLPTLDTEHLLRVYLTGEF